MSKEREYRGSPKQRDEVKSTALLRNRAHILFTVGLILLCTLTTSACKEDPTSYISSKLKKGNSVEATISLQRAGEGAKIFFQKGASLKKKGRRSGGPQLAPSPKSHQYPTKKNTKNRWLKCTSTGNELGEASAPNISDFKQSPWSDIKFMLTQPHHYQYCYEGTPTTFRITATASFFEDSDSIFVIEGSVQGKVPVVGGPKEQ